MCSVRHRWVQLLAKLKHCFGYASRPGVGRVAAANQCYYTGPGIYYAIHVTVLVLVLHRHLLLLSAFLYTIPPLNLFVSEDSSTAMNRVWSVSICWCQVKRVPAA